MNTIYCPFSNKPFVTNEGGILNPGKIMYPGDYKYKAGKTGLVWSNLHLSSQKSGYKTGDGWIPDYRHYEIT